LDLDLFEVGILEAKDASSYTLNKDFLIKNKPAVIP
jgi:hypothetical protein